MERLEERLNEILKLALDTQSSDIHFEIRGYEVNIKLRTIDGLKKIKSSPSDRKLIRYLQYLANLDVGNILVPQTGQFEYNIADNDLSLRFAILNSLNLTSAVLRILNNNLKININRLSTVQSQNEYFKKIIKRQSGLIIFSGPTGSGKTTTLYSLLDSLTNKMIYTIEDPIEIYNEKYVQLQVNEQAGLTYETGLRQILRHDPDIIMIGEIRDKKAAMMAVNAANTGHLVLTSLHASTAASAISRMEELGVNTYQLYEVLIASINQRLLVSSLTHTKTVLYEIMDEDELDYYRKHNMPTNNYQTIKSQYREKVKQGIYEDNLI